MFNTVDIVVVGSEFFSRDKRDTNSIWLTEQLEKRGVKVLSKSVVADHLEELTRVVKRALEGVDLVISTGGLGPTEDDRTREAVARAFGAELTFRQEIADEIERRFAKRGRTMAENNRSQAYIPEGAEIVENPTGTAPGFICRGELGTFLALPGPPGEMNGMFLDFLDKHRDSLPSDTVVTARRTLKVTGLGESDMDHKISDLYKDLKNPEVTINFTPHDLEIHLTARAQSGRQAEQLIEPVVEKMEERLEGYLFSTNDESLGEVVVKELKRTGLTLAAAESITGGHLAHSICSVPGASEVFAGSVVSYTEECKRRLLGVSQESLNVHGAVSEVVAREMVEGLFRSTGAPVCVACTGFAGPGGGTDQNPVGTVYLALRTAEKTSVKRVSLPGSRNLVRSRTTQALLYLLFRFLRKQKSRAT